jgi:alpha-glucosidase
MSLARLALICSAAFGIAGAAGAASMIPNIGIASPDGHILVNVIVADGQATYSVSLDGKELLQKSRLGVVRDDADFSQGVAVTANYLTRAIKLEKVEDRYELLTSKRRQNVYRANRRVFEVETQAGARMDIEFQVSNDGFAFRYVFPGSGAELRKISRETSSFNFLPDTRGWLQPIAPPRSGWHEANPSYEEYYERDIPVGQPSLQGGAWVFPALFRSSVGGGDTWLLVSESGLRRNYCGSRLLAARRSSEYFIDFPGPLETSNGGAVTPESTLPWTTPWRLAVIGSLKTIAESTLGTDLADPPAKGVKLLPELPGKAAWSWPLLGDDQTTVKVQKQFIDYAAEMGWQYTLVDSAWDRQIGYDGLKQLVEYGKPKGVKILIWYNSAGEWNTTPLTPRDKMLPATRLAEMQKIKELGIAGVKVDFFAGDAQSTIAYYHDILEDAARVGLAVNFHGATVPRGWQRTYPNLMSMESVRGMEYNTFEQSNAEQGPIHAAMLPFTRNVFDPMDFTPVVLDKLPRTERRTSAAFELATAVLFTSGIQHYAEIPGGMHKAPPYVREFLKHVPSVWDDVKFVEGFPGQYVVMARRAGKTWYVAGINADQQIHKVKLDLKALGISGSGTLITNGLDPLGFESRAFPVEKGATAGDIEMRGRGGFVLTLQ